MMISKIKNMKKALLTMCCTVLLAALGTTTVEARYNAIYFDARFDMTRYRLNINASGFDTNGRLGLEDKYVSVWSTSKSSGATTAIASRSSNEYYKAMNPDDEKKPYKNTNGFLKRVNVEKYAKKFDPGRYDVPKGWASPKKNTVPAGLYKLTDKDGNSVDHKGMKADEGHGKVLTSAVCGIEDREDKGMSMEQAFNVLLEKIDILRGGYTDATFKETVKGLTYLIHYGAQDSSIEFELQSFAGVSSEVDENINKTGTTEEQNTTDPTKDDFIGDGTNLTVKISKATTHKKGVEIWQSNKKVLEEVLIPYKLSTGYSAESIGPEGEATIKLTSKTSSNEVVGTTLTAEKQLNLKGLTAEDIAYITLYDLVFDAFIKLNIGVTSSGTANDSTNPITNLIVDIADGLVGFVEEQLSLERMEDLVYNLESREQNLIENDGYDLGLYPKAWKSLIQDCLNIVTLLSTLFLVFAVLRVLFLMNLDSMNVSTRLNLKQDIMNIILAVIGMIMFSTVFYVLGLFNYKITIMMYNGLPGSNIDFFTSFVGTSGALAAIIMRCIMLGVKVYLNVVYLMRSLNISILLILAPIFIVGTAFLGPERLKVFLRELVGNIFIQSFHALVIWFIINAKQNIGIDGDGTDLFISVVMAVSIIPVTSMFRDMVFGDSKSLGTAGRIASQAQNTVKGLGMQGLQMASGALSLAKGGVSVGANVATADTFSNFKDFEQRQAKAERAGKGPAVPGVPTGAEAVKKKVDEMVNGKKSEGTETVDTKGKETVDTSAAETVDTKGKETVNTSAAETVDTKGKETVDTSAAETVDTKGKETVDTSAAETVDTKDKETVDTSAADSPSTATQYGKYFDSELKKGYTAQDIKKAERNNATREMIALSNALKSGGTGRPMQEYLQMKQDNKKMLEYMKDNTVEIHQKYEAEKAANKDEHEDGA